MQEQLDFSTQVESGGIDIPIEFNQINTGLLSSANDFIDDLDRFNNAWAQYLESDIQVLKSARWQQGSYDKFKALAIKAWHPRLTTARTINGIFNADGHYNYNKLDKEVR